MKTNRKKNIYAGCSLILEHLNTINLVATRRRCCWNSVNSAFFHSVPFSSSSSFGLYLRKKKYVSIDSFDRFSRWGDDGVRVYVWLLQYNIIQASMCKASKVREEKEKQKKKKIIQLLVSWYRFIFYYVCVWYEIECIRFFSLLFAFAWMRNLSLEKLRAICETINFKM